MPQDPGEVMGRLARKQGPGAGPGREGASGVTGGHSPRGQMERMRPHKGAASKSWMLGRGLPQAHLACSWEEGDLRLKASLLWAAPSRPHSPALPCP